METQPQFNQEQEINIAMILLTELQTLSESDDFSSNVLFLFPTLVQDPTLHFVVGSH